MVEEGRRLVLTISSDGLSPAADAMQLSLHISVHCGSRPSSVSVVHFFHNTSRLMIGDVSHIITVLGIKSAS
jgi:hypothetical protein